MSKKVRSSFWLVTLVAALSMEITASLGLWQIGRAGQKRALHDAIEAKAMLPAWTTSELLDSAHPEVQWHRPVGLTGHWIQGATVFLDNRPLNGRSGFIVLTPLRLPSSDRAVLIQRGWVPRDFSDRTRLPVVSTPEVEVHVQGRLAPPPSQLFDMGTGAAGPIRQNVELDALSREWSIPLLQGVSVQQLDADDSGLLREWPRFAGDEHKHLAYAAQWFAMCAVIGGLYFWFQIYLPRSKRPAHGSDAR